ncbi:hypothetical protein GLOIN_2v1771468 [Rhizophagus irregularis DAOM 181602=DAOM 197198]|nr:hypothetical protein GLOIN_2v1771468 [Rhizophagus irregularis DAOM 181602=DAOM 197198]
MPSATLSCTQLPNNFFCSTCGKGFKNSKEFKQVLVSEIHKKLSLNFRNPVSWNSSINSPSSQNQLDDDMDPLEQLLQSSIKNCKSNNQKKATTIFERRNFN